MTSSQKAIFMLGASLLFASPVYADASSSLRATQNTKLVQKRKNMYALFLRNKTRLLDGCKQLSPGSENKGESLMFPIGLASPFFVDTSGIVAGLAFKDSRLERVWCLGSGDTPKPLNPKKYRNPVWAIEVANFQKGTELGRMPLIPDKIDIYVSSVFNSSTTSQYSLLHKNICSQATSNGPSGIIITKPCK